jgi:hypothetical protein
MIDYKKYIPTNKNTLVFIGVILFTLLFLRQCNTTSDLKNELELTKVVADRALNNYKASQDTIKNERNKKGELVSSKLSYEYDVNSLSNITKNAVADYQRALNLTKDIKNINSLLRAEIRIKDSIINSGGDIVSISDSTYVITFADEKNWDKYNWRRFDGTVNLLRNKSINEISLTSSRFNFSQGIELKAAIVNEKGVNSLKITTPYPGLEFTNIENINLVNDKLNNKERVKHWSLGVGIGYGLNLNTDQIITVGPSINISIQWSPKWLRF